jgi:hypothetical protein
VKDADDLNGSAAPVFEKEPVVAAAKAVSTLRRLQLLDVPVARREVAIHAVEDVEGGLAIDAAQIGAGFYGPNDR